MSEKVQLMRTIERDDEAVGYSDGVSEKNGLRTRTKVVLVVGALGVATALIAGNAIKMSRDAQMQRNGKAEGWQESNIITEQATDRHIQVANKFYILRSGVKVRENNLASDGKYWGIVPDNIKTVIETGQVGVVKLPLVRTEGDTWIEFTDAKNGSDIDKYETGSATALATATYSVDLDEYKSSILVCEPSITRGSAVDYATVTPNFSYQGDKGENVATFDIVSEDDIHMFIRDNPFMKCD